MNVQTTSDDIEVYVVDHDVMSDGSLSELKHYLAEMDAPVDVDAVVLEDELMAKLEDLTDEGKAKLEDMTDAWDADDGSDSGEVYDLARVMRSGR